MYISVSKISVLVLTAALAVGCASQGDVDAINTRLDATDKKADDAAAASASALAAAQAAEAKAASAESAALRAAAASEEANNKLDRMFRRSMMK